MPRSTNCSYEGKYLIQTEEPNLSAVEAVRLYKDLSEVERAFASLNVIDMRPIYHRTDDRVRAHIFVAALAFLLHRAIEKKLKAAGIDLSATEALTRAQISTRRRHRSRRRLNQASRHQANPAAAAVLRALGIRDIEGEVRTAFSEGIKAISAFMQLGVGNQIKRIVPELMREMLARGPHDFFFIDTIGKAIRYRIHLFGIDRPPAIDAQGICNACL
jgi:hypothetical protein